MTSKEKVELYLEKHPQWNVALLKLRGIMLDTGLVEDYKWSLPVYTLEGNNIAGIGATKNYVGVWFFQGGSPLDKAGVLTNAQEGKTKAMRQWRFYNDKEIEKKLLVSYLKEAIKNQQEGKIIKPIRNKKLTIPAFLAEVFKNDPELKKAFDALTLGRKRDFAEYIESAKQESTRNRRLQKIIPIIMDGIGLNDKYQ